MSLVEFMSPQISMLGHPTMIASIHRRAEEIEQFITSGLSLQKFESMLLQNRLRKIFLFKKRISEITAYHGVTDHSLPSDPENIGIPVIKQCPTRNTF